MAYTYTIPKVFRKTLARKAPKTQAAILEAMDRLAEDPRHPSLRTSKLAGGDDWYCRSSKGDRIQFEMEGTHITFVANCNHDMLRRA